MSFPVLLSKMAVLFCFLAVGVLCSKAGFLDDHACGKLNKLVINICAPAMVLNSVLSSEYTYSAGDILALFGFAVLFNGIMILCALALSALLFRGHPDRGTYAYMLAFGNCVFMAFTVMASLFGDGAVFLGAVCSLPFNMLSFSVGIIMIGGKQGFQWKKLVNPPFLAMIAALLLFLFPVDAPAPVLEIVSGLGGMVVPLSMILIGSSLSSAPLKEIFGEKRIWFLCLGKLVIAPLAVFFICRELIADRLFLNVIVISAVMPTATVSPILAAEYGGNPRLAGRGVFVTTLCSLFTIPVLLSFLLV